ncbi:MAG: acetate kinase [Limnospira sp. PMC 1291.21]|uniref:Acetate kinase n=3 Tax=Limnospira TaxID=2596745 RepID=A0A9P1KIK3_9CYAN|nr:MULTISPECIES: acetate kinase [Limnospira]EKD08215.1 acetate kinase [Arthrospira platensis C1]MDC0836945.1 acetate kinase [Limnoraphis robusta]MDY7054471.1 acetate kinase [Limnospira fusiformis LS22]QJB25264.1 acetate kinase [Limnospira fusiformis SAG 85.79]EDZ92119.1 acetate kinase [Limnospira maxima CS-328]
MKILVLNAGSSSQKSCLYDLNGDSLPSSPLEPIWEAAIDWGMPPFGEMKVKANGVKSESKIDSEQKAEAIGKMLNSLIEGETKVLNSLGEINVVGHRVVHGGTDYSRATIIDEQVKEAIARLIPLAPAHNPSHLQGISAIEKVLGNVPQVAVFDTAFHSQMPLYAAVYPIPYEWFTKGIRRYGFHGTSHKYCGQRAAQLIGKPLESLRLITCHLGNGCSLAAIRDGISVNTTMGFTPLEGLMMGTRSGSIDPAILIFLMREYGWDSDRLNQMLNQQSGLKGITGISGDMRYVQEEQNSGNERAILAFEMFIHRLRTGIGSMLASLGGLDGLVFTAGIGEHAGLVRQETCKDFEFIGLKLDPDKNRNIKGDGNIAASDSQVPIFVIHTEEDWAIATECWHLLKS